MTIVLAILVCGFFGLSIFLIFWGKWLERRLLDREAEVAAANRAIEDTHRESKVEIARAAEDARMALAHAQAIVDEQLAQLARESERVRLHYQNEAQHELVEMRAAMAKSRDEVESLRKYAVLKDAEEETYRAVAEAIKEAADLKKEAQSLVEQTRAAGIEERTKAQQKAKEIYAQAEARLNQATRDAGRITAEAERRAEQIGGDAYAALRDKELLEHAAEAIRNIVEGYGDRYIVPTHSILDDLAGEFGYDAAGESLRAAREQSQRMVLQGEAAACDYTDPSRRASAIRFVVHAFNGDVDSLLTRVKHDNYGVLEQKIKDSFSIVNRDGGAFRNARILPSYLNARLAELKWAVVVQELALRAREEQRYLNERRRDEEKAKREQEEKLRQAEKTEELKRIALDEAENKLAVAHADEKAALEQEVQQLRGALDAATERKLTIAQQTSKGSIYIISNVGSFGGEVFKIGLTRRTVEERVYELGGASVPFEFDVHAVIETDNAPALERKLHRAFLATRLNKVNLRKEFFRVKLSEIKDAIEQLKQGEDFTAKVNWTETARAQQYYDSLDIDKNETAKQKWLARTRLLADRRIEQDGLMMDDEPGAEAELKVSGD